MAEEEESQDTVVVHPNRERPEAKSTKAAVVLLLIVTAVLTFVIMVGGWSRIPGQKPLTLLFIVLFGVLAYYIWHWSRGTLAMAAGVTTFFFMAVVVALPGWFSRDKTGFDDPLLPAGLVGMLMLVLAFVSLAVIVISMVAFQQGWNVEVEVPREEAEGGVDPDKWDAASESEEEQDDEDEEEDAERRARESESQYGTSGGRGGD